MRRTLVTIVAILVSAAGPALAGWDEGVAAFTQKNFQKAAEEFKALVQQNPDGYRGYYMLGLCLDQLGRKEEALNHLRKAYDLNPNEVTVKLALGRAYMNMHRYADSAKLLSTVEVGSLPAAQKAAFYQMRGEARFRTNDTGGALQDFEQLSKLRPDDAQTQYLYGTTALSFGQLDNAVNALAKASRLAPKDGEKKSTYINSLIKQGRVSRDKNAKRQIYLRAAALAKELAVADPSYDNLLLECSTELGAGMFKEAAVTGQAAIRVKSSDWLAYFYLAQALAANQQYEQALPPLGSALKLASKPEDVKKIQQQRGFVFEKQKKFAESIEAYMAADDQASVVRVKDNETTYLENKKIEEDNKVIEQMREEAEALEKQLKEIGGGGTSGGGGGGE